MNGILKWLEDFLKSPLVIGIGYIIGLIGVLLTLRSLKNKKIALYRKSFNLFQDSVAKIGDLRILYRGTEVPNLTVTTFVIWNAGKETINSTDIAPRDPLRVTCKEDLRILNATVVHTSGTANNYSISEIKEGKSADIYFDYLDPGEGGVVQLLHTGTMSQDLSFDGTVKGAKMELRNPSILFKSTKDELLFYIFLLGMIFILTSFATFILAFFLTLVTGNIPSPPIWYLITFTMTVTAMIVYYNRNKKVPKHFAQYMER